MPVRVRNIRPKIVLLLAFLGLQAGLAAGPVRTSAGGAESRPAKQLAAAVVGSRAGTGPIADVPASPAADALAAQEAPASPPADSSATAEPVVRSEPAAPISPAAAIVPADRLHLEPILVTAARQHGVPADMILAQAWAESSWRVDAVSHKGAVGVLQLMPTAVDFVSKNLLKLEQPLDALNPADNARMGARYMRHLLDRLDGDMRQALIAYNQGLAGLRRKGPVPAAESYADKVLALRPAFAGA
ncbi:MAG TPA: transglycosylase SLT domain-containing protein [Acidimicrobiia bacterium]|nr:transglycosylase SLT domain-containing protein [Acidimicrobiia bacterium]